MSSSTDLDLVAVHVSMARQDNPPTREVGTVTDQMLPTAGTSWTSLMQDDEYVPELQWPTSLASYDRLRADPRIAGILLAFLSGILKRRAVIVRNGAREDVLAAISEDWGIPIEGDPDDKPRPPMEDRFDHPAHMETTLDQILTYGHYITEMVGEIETSDRKWWRLRDLSPRPAKTISSFNMEPRTGKLKSITQFDYVSSSPMLAEHVAMWIFRKKPGSFVGTPPIRYMHKPYLLKDGATRITMTNIEKAGGIPYAAAPLNAGTKVLQAISSVLSRFRVGTRSNAVFPHGTKVDFAKGAGVGEGIDFINLQNEEISFAAQAMFAGLGQGGSSGNRALGETLADAFMDQQDAVAQLYTKGCNRTIERVVRWNVGPGEQSPLLKLEKVDALELTIEALEALKRLGVTITEQDIEAVRKRYGMAPTPDGVPAFVAPTPAPKLALVPPGQDGGEGDDAPVAASAPFRPQILAADGPGAPKRDTRRPLTARESAAGVDFAAMDEQRESSFTTLLAAWVAIRQEQIDDVRAQIVAADGDLQMLARLQPEARGAGEIVEAMLQLADDGVRAVIAEAAYQGVTLPEPVAQEMYDAVIAQATATAQLLADDIGLAASNAAVRFASPGLEPLNPLDVAELVADELDERSLRYIEDQLFGMVTCGQAIGRFGALANAPEGTRLFATELLDANTCEFCEAIDETEFPTLAAAMRAYPTGGFIKCAGRRRCRGSVFARYGDEAEATMNGDEFDVAASAGFDPGQRRGPNGRWIKFLVGDNARSTLADRHVDLDEDQQDAVRRYSDGEGEPGSNPVNMPLRTGELSDEAAADVALLDSAIEAQLPLEQDLILWRGIGPNGIDRLRTGGVDHGFTSASTSREHVEANYLRDGSQLLMVRVPAGRRVLHMPSVGEGGTLSVEDEVLIGRSATLQIAHEGADGVIEVSIS